MGASHIQVLLFFTDVPRGIMGRRELNLDRRQFPNNVPWVVTKPGEDYVEDGLPLPALVGLRGELRSLDPDKRGRIRGASWVVTPAPYVNAVVQKFWDRQLRMAMLLPLVKQLSAFEPREHAWFEVHCGAAACNDVCGSEPFLDIRFGSYNARQVMAENQKIVDRWFGLPHAINLFRRFVGYPDWYPAGYVATDPWQKEDVRKVIERLINERAVEYADHLWRAWFMDSFYADQLRISGIRPELNVPTRFEPGGTRTIMAGFDRHTVYFPEEASHPPVRKKTPLVIQIR